jgi:cytochrome P450
VTTHSDQVRFDPLVEGVMDDPYPAYRELRRTCPVAPSMGDFAFVSRHHDVSAALRAHREFSGALGMRIDNSELPAEERTINETEPPRHTTLRRLLVAALSPGAIADLEGRIRELARGLVDMLASDQATAAGRPVDLVAGLTIPLPITLIAELMGVSPEDRGDFRRWSDDIMEFGIYGRDAIPTLGEFNAYVDREIERRLAMADPPDDLITRLVTVEEDGERLHPVSARNQIRFLIMAGNETTTNFLGNLVYDLLARGLWERLVSSPSLVPAAIEEALRFSSPVQFIPRTCVADTTIADQPTGRGRRVLLGLGSANRDEATFERADEFLLERGSDIPHLAFGRGIHVCVGAPLARLEGRVVLETLLERFPRLGLAEGFTYERVRAPMARGPRRLDAVLDPGPRT